MSQRTIARRLRRLGLIGPAAAVAALALAPGANAATFVYTPGTASGTTAANGTALASVVGSADANPAGSLSIIELCGQCTYGPVSPLPLSGNIEITGPPTYQVGTTGLEPDVTGANITTLGDVLSVNAGAHVLFKGFVANFAPFGAANIGNHGGTVEIDNMAVDSSNGTGITNYVASASTTVNNSLIANEANDGVQMNGGTMTLNQDTIAIEGTQGIDGVNNSNIVGTVTMHNTLLLAPNQSFTGGQNCLGTVTATTDSRSDDTTCGGATVDTNLSTEVNTLFPQSGNGGPTDTLAVNAGSALIGTGNPLYCAKDDQRFFLLPAGTPCDPGSYQTAATNSNQTTPPTCTIVSINGTSNPQTMVVSATDGGIGVGADVMGPPITTASVGAQTLPTATLNVASTAGFAVSGSVTVQSSTGTQTLTYTGKTPTSFTGVSGGTGSVATGTAVMGPSSATTDNGTVGWPTYSGTLLAMTNPGAPAGSGLFGQPSNAAFPVTATKPMGDAAHGDTHWSFTATNWLGESKVCN